MSSTPKRQQVKAHSQAELFTVRLWCQALGDGRSEWRGKVEHVLGGESLYFRDWADLVKFLMKTSRSGDLAGEGGDAI